MQAYSYRHVPALARPSRPACHDHDVHPPHTRTHSTQWQTSESFWSLTSHRKALGSKATPLTAAAASAFNKHRRKAGMACVERRRSLCAKKGQQQTERIFPPNKKGKSKSKPQAPREACSSQTPPSHNTHIICCTQANPLQGQETCDSHGHPPQHTENPIHRQS
jgi:hypothetical protein